MSNERLSRRAMLKAAGAVGVTSAGVTTNAVASLGKPPAHRIDVRDFADEVGAIFKTSLADGASVNLKLAEIKALPSRGARPLALPRRSAFVAVFDTPEGMPHEERIYNVRHPRLGKLDLLMQPVVDDTGAKRLEAVFN